MTLDPSYGLAAAMNDRRMQAVDLYRRQAWQGRMRRFWAFVTRTSGHLQQLCSGTQGDQRVEGAYVGMRTIAIEQICGSEERAEDFDPLFRPLATHNRDRWLSVAEARLRGLALPPVQLLEVNGHYYVRDGHHRISVAQALGESFVDAEVVRWQIR
jgi:uncharacterized ParB-like nuclease family protein